MSAKPLLRLEGISKALAGVQALDGVSVGIDAADIVCLAGENGSGKSTLVKVLPGVVAPDGGRIVVDGQTRPDWQPIDAVRAGIQVFYQDFSLFPNLTVAENISFNDELSQRRRLVRWPEVRRTAQQALAKVGVDVGLDILVEDLGVADKQGVAIRARHRRPARRRRARRAVQRARDRHSADPRDLGTGLIFAGIAVVLSGGAAVLGFPDAISVLGNGAVFGVPVPVLLFAALAAAVAFVLNWTGFGLRVYLLGTNPLAARFAGIDNVRVDLGTYLISGVPASVAGLIIAVRANSAKADYGSSYPLLSILISVLGGIDPYGGFGKVSGLVLAVLSLQFLSSGLNMLQVSNFAVDMTWGALLLLVMVINTGGLRRLFGAFPATHAKEEAMKKLINRAEDFVPEMLDGLVKAHPDELAFAGEPAGDRARRCAVQGKVALATGGGSGHLPVFLGYVGRGPPGWLRGRRRVQFAEQRHHAQRHPPHPRRQRRRLHLRQLWRRRDELRHGLGDGRRSRTSRCGPSLVRDDVASPARKRPGAAASQAWCSPSRSAGAKADAGGSPRRGGGGREHALANLRTMGVALVAAARCRAWASPPSRSARARWKSAWASTASRAASARSWRPPTRLPGEWRRRSWPISAVPPATAWP